MSSPRALTSPASNPRKHPNTLLCLAGLLGLQGGGSLAKAETSIAYKYEDYSETNDRIQVHAQYAQVEQTLTAEDKLKLMGVIDSISGATPTGQTGDVTTEIHDKRKSWTAEYSHQLKQVNLSLGLSNSRESDYVSDGVSLNTVTDFNEKNTQLVLGVAGTDDKAKVYFQSPWKKKHGEDLIVGVNQLLDPKTTVSFDLSFGRATGYLSDPYKLVEKNTQLLPGIYLPLTFNENRPDQRNKVSAYTSLNHAFDAVGGAVEASYRYYTDSFGTHSHTLTASWFQKVGEVFTLVPSARLYQQGAADFYYATLSGTNITPSDTPTGKGPYYSSDYRLSRLRSVDLGLKLVWKPKDWLQLDVAYDRYNMTGLDHTTDARVYPKANIYTVGAQITW